MDPSGIDVRPVAGRRERRIFLTYPWRIYRRDSLWVPPVLAERAARLDPKQNPLFDHGDVVLYMAWQGRRPVGTIGVAVDRRANTYREVPLATFGFFECEEDPAVARALLTAAVTWARTRNVQVLRGPLSFDNADEPGVLVEGRETPPGLMMGWTAPYYQGFIEDFGFERFHDALAYRVILADYVDDAGELQPPPKLGRVAAYVRRRYGDRCRLRHGDLRAWGAELERARQVFNRALVAVPDHVPLSPPAWQAMARSIQPLLQQELTCFVELDGDMVGFALALPDISTALQHCNGLRMPWDYVKLWWHSRRLPGATFKIMAMVPEVHGLGLDALVYLYIAEACRRAGYAWLDMSLTTDDNPTTTVLADHLGVNVSKRYRVYELRL